MPPKRTEPPDRPIVALEDVEGSTPPTVRAVWPVVTVRFMFGDGSLVDVVTAHDDSRLRAVLVDRFGPIAGSVVLTRD